MIKVGMVGLGKVGLSHLAVLRAHSQLDLVAACDPTTCMTGVLSKHAGLRCLGDFDRMLNLTVA